NSKKRGKGVHRSTVGEPHLLQAMQSRREGSPSRSLPRRRDLGIRTEFIRIEGAIDGDEVRDNSSLIANTPGSTPRGTPCGKRLRNDDDARYDGKMTIFVECLIDEYSREPDIPLHCKGSCYSPTQESREAGRLRNQQIV
ncbi:hypothetical protein FS842_003404, partial [Serendipita sp. 407]